MPLMQRNTSAEVMSLPYEAGGTAPGEVESLSEGQRPSAHQAAKPRLTV